MRITYSVVPTKRNLKLVFGSYTKSLRRDWGLSQDTASTYALLIILGNIIGGPISVVSGLRTQEENDRLRERFEAGDPSVLVAPAVNSQHLIGSALDISAPFSVLRKLGALWTSIGLTWGGNFKPVDISHFDLRSIVYTKNS